MRGYLRIERRLFDAPQHLVIGPDLLLSPAQVRHLALGLACLKSHTSDALQQQGWLQTFTCVDMPVKGCTCPHSSAIRWQRYTRHVSSCASNTVDIQPMTLSSSARHTCRGCQACLSVCLCETSVHTDHCTKLPSPGGV